jgi:hypothetical protein
MNIILKNQNVEYNNFYYGKKISNTIIPNSYFHNIYYCSSDVQINNIYINITLKNVYISEYFNKYKCCFNKIDNLEIFKMLNNLEKNLLNIFPNELINEYKMNELFNNGEIKFITNKKVDYKESNINMIIKLSGMWHNDTTKGLIFKFIV